jgi:WD40 repeat protein
MIKVAPQAQIALRHRADHVTPAKNGRIAVLSNLGVGTFLWDDLTLLSEFSIPQRPSQAALSPDGTLLAVTASDGITFYSTTTFEKVHYMNDAYQWCSYGSDGVFWTSCRFTAHTAVLEAWDLSKKTRIAKVKIGDPFDDSAFLLFPHPLPNSVVVWAAAGQDGQVLFWASLDGQTIQVDRFDEQDFTSPPAFNSSGKEFLISDEGSLYRYLYPSGPLLAHLDHLAEDEYAGENICYLDDGQALVTSAEGKLFVVDVVDMQVHDEVSLVGEDHRPICYFIRLAGGRFLSVHRDFSGTSDLARDRLMVWPSPTWR